MTIVYASDSDGVSHQLWAQRQANSCSVAAIWMARGIARQMTFSEDEWNLAWRMYHVAVAGMCWSDGPPPPTAPRTLDSSKYDADQSSMYSTFASSGVYATQVADMLRNEGLNINHVGNNGNAITVDTVKLGNTKPAIVLVGWYTSTPGGNQRTGGHFVVAVRVAGNGKIVFLDPWEGVVREAANVGRYPGGGLLEEAIYISA